MAIIRKKELRKLTGEELEKRLSELQASLAKERASVAIGAPVSSPGKLREMRKTIARIKTVQAEKPKMGVAKE